MKRFPAFCALCAALALLLSGCEEMTEQPAHAPHHRCPDWLTSQKGQINIGVTGGSGNGKSTLLNTKRCLNDSHPDAAPTGTDETTMEPTPYSFRGLPVNVSLWDLPGVGTESFPTAGYVRNMGLACFDVIILVSSKRFREEDRTILKALDESGVPYFFVRTHVNIDVDNGIRQHMNESETLQTIRSKLVQKGISNPYLISGLLEHRRLFDYFKLEEDVISAVFKVRNLSLAEDFTEIRRQIFPCEADKEKVSGSSKLLHFLEGYLSTPLATKLVSIADSMGETLANPLAALLTAVSSQGFPLFRLGPHEFLLRFAVRSARDA